MADNYFIENKETGKIELHFDKAAYMALTEEQKKEIKSNFLFSRYSKAWVSRCKFPNLHYALKVAESLGLENAGATGERLSFAEQQEVKQQKAINRADYYDYKSTKAENEANRLQKPINDMHGDIAFFTQPNINTSAGRAFTRKRDKMWANWEQGMEEFRKSAYYQHRAEIARSATDTPSIDFCQRRIDEAKSSIKKLTSNIELYENRLAKVEAGEEVLDSWGSVIHPDPESLKSNIERWSDMLENALGKAAYYDAIIQEQGGIKFNKDNIKVGYIVKLRQTWKGNVIVTSTGSKNIKYRDIERNSFELTANYSEIESIISTEVSTEVKHPFTVGEVFTVKEWNGNEYADIEYTITKVTPEKVTIKAGTNRARTIRVRKSYNGKDYIISVADGMHGYYAKSIS